MSSPALSPGLKTQPAAFPQRFRFIKPTLPPLEAVIAAYAEAYSSGIVTNAGLVERFEHRAAERLGVRHCVAVSSCTSGLMLVLRALGVSGEVILPSFTFFATGEAVLWNGLRPVFADCDPETWNLDPADVRRKITNKTGAIVAVHMYGNPCAASQLESIAAQRGLKLIFDAAHAFGSEHKGRPVGQFGDAEVFSLSPTKLLIAGEGGLVSTNDGTLAGLLRAGRNYGDLGAYDPHLLGVNARMSEFNAALALAGMDILDAKIDRHNAIASAYTERLSSLPGLRFQKVAAGDLCTYKDFSVHVDADRAGISRDALAVDLLADNIETKKYFYPPLHRQQLFRGFHTEGSLSCTDSVSNGILSLPVYESLSDEIVEGVARAIRRHISRGFDQAAEVTES